MIWNILIWSGVAIKTFSHILLNIKQTHKWFATINAVGTTIMCICLIRLVQNNLEQLPILLSYVLTLAFLLNNAVYNHITKGDKRKQK